jgi:hypothetical protein
MEDYVKGSWLDFEAWIRREIGSDFRWKVRPMDNPSKRRLVAELILDTRRRNKGVFPKNDAFIERISDPGRTEEVEDGS